MKYAKNPFLPEGAPRVSFIDAVLEREVSMDYPEVSVRYMWLCVMFFDAAIVEKSESACWVYTMGELEIFRVV